MHFELDDKAGCVPKIMRWATLNIRIVIQLNCSDKDVPNVQGCFRPYRFAPLIAPISQVTGLSDKLYEQTPPSLPPHSSISITVINALTPIGALYIAL